jgi:alpha-amylase
LLTTIKNQGDELAMKDKEIVRLQAKIEKIEDANKKEGVKEPKAKKPSASKKSVAKKPTTKSKKSVEEQKKDKK